VRSRDSGCGGARPRARRRGCQAGPGHHPGRSGPEPRLERRALSIAVDRPGDAGGGLRGRRPWRGGIGMREVLQRRVRSTELPFCAHAVGEEEIAEVAATLGSAWITTGPKVKQFEEDFSRFVGAPAALAVNSCTAALHLALVTLGVGPGHRVITSPMTFCASVNVIEHVGARRGLGPPSPPAPAGPGARMPPAPAP